ncbi:hypothetical protein KM043_007912 [Ampulex compressa]|nr:hypothetical protein KM043_007912 [Ampulex compressa]
MDIFETPYYNRARLFLTLIGQWPYDRSTSKYLSRLVFCLIIGLFTIAQIRTILDEIKLEWTILTERNERTILQECAEEANLFVQKIVSCFTISLVVQLVLIVVTLTGLLLQLHMALTPLEDVGFVILTVCRVIGHFFVVFFNILPAQIMLDASADMFIKAYNSDWYMAPIKSQKLLLFIMQRTIEPTIFSVANILQMKLEIFATITQLSMSYFTVIHSVQL